MTTDEPERTAVFIYCDDPSHDGRRVAVATFRRSTPYLGWVMVPHSKRPRSLTKPGSSARILWNDAVDQDEIEDGVKLEMRARYSLVCRKCEGRGVVAREANLFAVLNAFATRGISEVSLGFVDASLARSNTPEPEQG